MTPLLWLIRFDREDLHKTPSPSYTITHINVYFNLNIQDLSPPAPLRNETRTRDTSTRDEIRSDDERHASSPSTYIRVMDLDEVKD
jgi:hypothetical protein